MKLKTDIGNEIVISEVFSGAYLETAEGNRIGFCMRDDTIEFTIITAHDRMTGKTRVPWFRVNMQEKTIDRLDSDENIVTDTLHDPASVQ